MKHSLRSLAAIAGTVAAAWLAGAGPAAAHEGSSSRVPAASIPASAGGGTGELPGVAEYSPPPPAAMVSTADRWSALSVMVAATGVLASGAAAVAVAVRRRRGSIPWPGRLQLAGAFSLLFAGVAHCALAPSHWAEGWHLGAFFVASGMVLVCQAGLVLLRPSPAIYRSVVVSTVGIILLYVAVRQFDLPLVNHQDPYLLREIPVKLAELFAANVALTALARLRSPEPAAAPWFGRHLRIARSG